MTASLVLFYIAAALGLAGAIQALRSREPRAALRALAVVIGAAVAVDLLLVAPWVALFAAIAGGLVIAVMNLASGLGGDAPAGPRRRRATIAGLALIAGLTWIFLGTWGRQLAFPGHDLAPGASFGSLRQAATALAGETLTLPLALPLLLFAGLVGALALLDEGQRSRRR
ncbi:MAG: hypothetical protein H6710_08215 [Myxococcales bacterium]|nr:hypothetical protein [Myxococcales bacterium]MCB9704232.1 hypothetical protein [Myxococcales bacterium]